MNEPSLLEALEDKISPAELIIAQKYFKNFNFLIFRRYLYEFSFVLFIQILCFTSFKNDPFVYFIGLICGLIILYFRSKRALISVVLGFLIGTMII